LKYEPADIFFIAGEASGDLQASLLAGSVRNLRPQLKLAAIGSDRLRAAGVPLAYDSSDLASIGPLSVIPRIPLLYGMMRRFVAAMRERPSRLLVPVDLGAVNLRVISRLRSGGYARPIVYYFPPGAWLDDARQARKVAELTLPLTPFAHQRDFYQRLALPVVYFGHPLVSVIPARTSQPLCSKPRIVVLPGSRREEVGRHIPVLARAAREVGRLTCGSFLAVAASEKRAAQIRSQWARFGGPPELAISREGTTHALHCADLAWVASGTAVLEAALVEVPQIAFYRLSRSQYRIGVRRHAHLLRAITLPNLVLGRTIVPELVQDAFTASGLVKETLLLLERDDERTRQIEAYGELRNALGPPDALARIADFVVGQLEI
jgi:lipid-A-disaccharide synthase